MGAPPAAPALSRAAVVPSHPPSLASAPADRDPQYVSQGLDGPGQREAHGRFPRPAVGQHGSGTAEYVFRRGELSGFDVVGEEGETAVVVVGVEVAGLAVEAGP